MLAVAKQLKQVERKMLRGKREDFFGSHNALELYSRRLGIIGLGRIGSYVAKIALVLGMEVEAYDPYISADLAAELGVKSATNLEPLLAQADIVTLHVPLSARTHHLINARRPSSMKRGAILINASRGGIVDEAALLDAWESGQVGGAGLDVFEMEPAGLENPLLNRDDVVVTPHAAGVNSCQPGPAVARCDQAGTAGAAGRTADPLG